MSHGGRPTHDFWEKGSYERRQEGDKIVAYCLICKKTLANAAKTRLQKHRNVCKNETDWSSYDPDMLSAPQSLQTAGKSSTDNNANVIETIELENIQLDSAVDAVTSSYGQNISNCKIIAIGVENTSEVPVSSSFDMPTVSKQEFRASTTLCQKKLKTESQKHTLESYIDNITDQQKARINNTLIKFFYGCNIPFEIVESKLFINFINAIRSAYKPLSAKVMSNEIHNAYAELWKHQSIFSYSEGLLIISKTKIKKMSHIIGFVQNQEKIIYLKTWNKKDDISLIINESITLANTKFNIKIYAVITNEDFQLLNADDNLHNNPWILQCNITFATFIEKKLINLEFAQKICYLLNQFSNKELENDLMTRGGIAVVLKDNSLYHNRNLFSACLQNLRVMTQIMGDRQYKFEKEIVNILIDETFEQELKHSLDLLKPVCCIAEKCEKSKIMLADAVEDRLMLVSTKYYNSVLLEIDAILTPIALTANIFHFVYRGQRFANNQDHMRKVMEFLINNLDEEGMNDFGKYKSSTEIFSLRRLKDYTDGRTFWQAVALAHPKLSSFAIKKFCNFLLLYQS